MESKEELYLERAKWATHAADWAEGSGTGELAILYRKIALLWQEMAIMAKRWPGTPA
jgi:hypothetical protein